ncbi:FKBP-type peptidyl-prolyl cis-trans isomerase [Alysiella crassa]|uniref:Peptidyl-prolyl cis-trans isomerase n=1 Tax=Alysiella crassa TaxID=153491 RepID=A0A376BW83_9NEIS|nr:FKBP-type peptidyl-prolyl cis-trans isomerase [Alysiella crassa]UOP06132.1 FKBP-type peptidyl-prolyl cis-trans isomerase [Alysiella crassa]SSY80604.1 Probable FKBP-type peptidyl-prolyl cis-trans isomerase fkpA precursor [Alysiella crassa]
MKKLSLTILAASIFTLAACQQATTNSAASGAAAAASGAVPAGLETQTKQVSYTLGQQMGEQLLQLKNNGGEIDVKVLAEGIQDKLDGKPSKMTEAQTEVAMKAFMETMTEKAKKKAEESQAAGDKFLTENKSKEGVKTTASGLQYKVNKEGTGASPALGDGVMVEYTGKLIDGTEFDSTKQQGGEPLAVPLTGNSVIPGWTEGLQLMKEGGEYTLYVPAKLAYGTMSPSPKIPANSVLVFDMKIVKVEKGVVKDQVVKVPQGGKENKK